MDDRIRASDADRDRATARLREHFAAGRLAPGELDERLSAALNAKTFGPGADTRATDKRACAGLTIVACVSTPPRFSIA